MCKVIVKLLSYFKLHFNSLLKQNVSLNKHVVEVSFNYMTLYFAIEYNWIYTCNRQLLLVSFFSNFHSGVDKVGGAGALLP